MKQKRKHSLTFSYAPHSFLRLSSFSLHLFFTAFAPINHHYTNQRTERHSFSCAWHSLVSQSVNQSSCSCALLSISPLSTPTLTANHAPIIQFWSSPLCTHSCLQRTIYPMHQSNQSKCKTKNKKQTCTRTLNPWIIQYHHRSLFLFFSSFSILFFTSMSSIVLLKEKRSFRSFSVSVCVSFVYAVSMLSCFVYFIRVCVYDWEETTRFRHSISLSVSLFKLPRGD